MSLITWRVDPLVVLSVALVAWLYARGWRRSRLSAWRAGWFAAGLATVIVALESPVGVYDQQLFVLHMTEHSLLMLVAAPLLLLGKPLSPLLWGLPRQERRGMGHLLARSARLSHPLIAMPLFVATVAVWHVPALYDLAQAETLAHYLEHAMFFTAALLFWQPAIHLTHLSRTAASLYFALPMFEGTLIGALLTFAARPFYATYALAPRVTSLSAVDDQQLAGLVMWIPGGIVYAGAVLVLLWTVLRDTELGGIEPQTTALT